MNNTTYALWVSPMNLARQIKYLQDEGSFIQSVKIVEKKNKPLYEVEYTNVLKHN